MTSIFFGGSRSLGRLSPEVKTRLDNVIERGFQVLIGDANGGDKSAQQYLAERGYRNVTVYCTDGACRNNVGGWPIKAIPFSGDKKGGFAFYTAKDDAMANDADYGLMVWDRKSKGTLRNVVNLARQDKTTAIYFAPERRFINVRKLGDATQLLDLCDADTVPYLEQMLQKSGISQTAAVARERPVDYPSV
ncbi:MAG: hypothetical protein HZB26_22895 [Candidatus Hydrogenedentes bacterium]|nr:hypothetical protein [Candidatus Hydrogenedentota bacterium]